MKRKYLINIIALLLFLTACNKLDEKPKQSLVVPETLQDLQGLLDNTGVLNANYPALGQVSCDETYLPDAIYNSLTLIQHKKAYIWDKNPFDGVKSEIDWGTGYQHVFYSNVALDGLKKLDPAQATADYNNIKGQALFHRAFTFFALAQEFAKPYNAGTLSADKGLPLRLNSDLNIPTQRSTLKETYDQIIGDLQLAKNLLPNLSIYKTRPSKASVYGLLSRIMLTTGDYEKTLLYADSCLKLYSTLINYNTLNASATFPFVQLNSEVIFQANLAGTIALLQSRANIDPQLYQSYQTNDLRKTLFFNLVSAGVYNFKGNYNGNGSPFFCGLAVDEIYLNRAEGYARTGKPTEAISDLNTLMQTRFKTGTFVPYTATNADDALTKILVERRKELLIRGLRWTDLRRLNKDPRFALQLSRTVNGQSYTLPPNDDRYTLPLPEDIVNMTGIEQNF